VKLVIKLHPSKKFERAPVKGRRHPSVAGENCGYDFEDITKSMSPFRE